MSDPVFVCEEAAAVEPGAVLTLSGGEARHAAASLRLGPGDVITVVDGKGTWARGTIAAAAPERVEVGVEAVGRDADPDVVLVQALSKNGRDEQAVESATELGATVIVPWQADRSISRWRGPKVDKGRHKWAELALAAAKQSRRAVVPEVRELVSTAALARMVADAVAGGARVLVLHEESAVPLASYTWDGFTGQVWLIVGPEGGIASAEVDALRAAGALPAVLGPHVLRASTAGPAAIAAIGAVSGWWQRAPEHRGGTGRAIR